MLTAVLVRLLPQQVVTPENDPDGDGVINDFLTRLTSNEVRAYAALFTAVIVLAVLWRYWAPARLKWTMWLIAFMAGWAMWGIVNFWVPEPQPLFILPVCLDFHYWLEGWHKVFLAIPVFIFFRIWSMGRKAWKFSQLIWAALATAGVLLLMTVGLYGWERLVDLLQNS